MGTLFSGKQLCWLVALLCVVTTADLSAREKKPKAKKKAKTEQEVRPEIFRRYTAEGGVLREVGAPASPADSLRAGDSTVVETPVPEAVDSVAVARGEVAPAEDSLRDGKKPRRVKAEPDTSAVRYSRLFRDTIPISRVMALSLPLPGFAQVYNKQAWKVPLFYGATGALLYFGLDQNKQYKDLKTTVDGMKATGALQSELNDLQRQLAEKNTARSLLFVGAAASWMYFMGDGVMNYQGTATNVKRATTLSMICPGLGQLYNGSYWKAPIVMGAFATMFFVIDYNSRGYNRYKTAYDLRTDGDDNTRDEFADISYVTDDFLKTLKNNFRRNRDLSIIITGALYLLNVVDAHVESQLKVYDVSDDLALRVEPTAIRYYTRANKLSNTLGLSLSLTF